jgi:hypothetical protein
VKRSFVDVAASCILSCGFNGSLQHRLQISLLVSNFDARNGWFGEIRCAAKSVPPQLQTNAAPAAWPNVNVGKVRTADRYAKRSESPQSALGTEMCMAQHLLLSALGVE